MRFEWLWLEIETFPQSFGVRLFRVFQAESVLSVTVRNISQGRATKTCSLSILASPGRRTDPNMKIRLVKLRGLRCANWRGEIKLA